jgi:hypothetical protein
MFSSRKAKQRAREIERLLAEIKRAEALLTEISSKLEDPECELHTAMRLSVCQKELQAYLHGIHYALGEDIADSNSAYLGEFTPSGI